MKRNYNPEIANPDHDLRSDWIANRFKKKLVLKLASILLLGTVQTFAQTEVCIPQPDYVDGNGITNVSIGSISNTTGLETLNYGDFTAMTVNLGRGVSYPVSIRLNTTSAYNVRIWVDWDNSNAFGDDEQAFSSVSEEGITAVVNGNIAVPATAILGNHRMRVGITQASAGSALPCYEGFNAAAYEDYTINVTPTPTCFIPGRPAAVNTAPGLVNFSWTAPSGGTTPAGYEYAVSTSNTPPTSGTAVTGTSATAVTVPMDVTGYIFVRSNCGGGYSEWVAGTFFNGVCIPTPDYVNGDGITNVTIGTINKESLAEEGNYGNYSDLSINVGQGVTQAFSITFGTDSAYEARIWVDWNNDLDFDDEGEQVYAGTSANRAVDVLRGSFTVPVTASLGAHRLRVGGGLTFGEELSPCLAGSLGTFEDYTINVTTPPTCFAPVNPIATTVASGRVNLSWTVPTPGTRPIGYEYAVTTTNTPPSTNGTATTSTSALNVVVTPNSDNFIHIRTNCGNGDYSDWMTIYHYNGYCIPDPNYVDDRGIINVTIGGINNTPSGEVAYYSDYTSQVANAGQGVSKQISITFNTSTQPYTTKIWVDWNNDLDFDDAGETVFTGTTATTSTAVLNGYINVPLTAALGNYRMRIGAAPESNDDPTPCLFNNYGMFQDYTLNVTAPPGCYTPNDFAVTSQTGGSATISWNAPSLGSPTSGYQYAVTTTAALPTENIINTTATTVTGVTVVPNAVNYLHVRTNCGGDSFSEWITITLYNGYCVPAPAYVDGDGITNVNIGSINNSTEGQEVYNDFSSQVANIGQGVTQQFSISLTVNNQYNVNMWIDFNDNLIFEDSEVVYSGVSPQGITGVIRSTFMIPVTAPLGNHRLRIAGSNGAEVTPCDIRYGGVYEDYTINVTAPPTCYTPLDPTGIIVAQGRVNLNWTAPELGVAPAGYEYAVTTSVSSPTQATPITGTSINNFALAADDTYYYLHVRSNCGSGDFSEWVISDRFRYLRGDTCATAVDLGTLTSPYTGNTDGAADNYAPECGNGPSPDIYYSIQVPNGYTLTIGVTDSDYNYTGSLFYGSCSTPVFLTCANNGNENPNAVYENLTGQTKTLYWVQDGSDMSSGDFTLSWTLVPPAACDRPRALDVNLTSLTSANISWNVPNTGAPTGYEYAITTSEEDPANDQVTYTTATSATGITITPNVDSFLYVRSACGTGSERSVWVHVPFYSGYCIPTNTMSTDYYINSITTTGAETNLSNTGTGYSGYANYSATQSVSTYGGGSFTITATTPNTTDTYLYNVWIDWNNNYDFSDAGERIVITRYLASPAVLPSITVPVGTPLGSYRMRIRNAHSGVLISPCGDQGYGETEDYTLNVIATPSCFPPYALTINPSDATTANISWSAPALGSIPAGYEYVFGPVATEPVGNGTFVEGTFVGDLEYDPAQSVYLFVRSKCGGNEYSAWEQRAVLDTENPQLAANNVIVYKNGNAIDITSGTTAITAVTVYDTRGRMLYNQSNINNTKTSVTDMLIQQQVVIVEITTTAGKVSKRIVF
jgi:hypothetical protein